MLRFLFMLMLLPVLLNAQIRVSKLVIGENETYKLEGSDILVADTLIMKASSTLLLNKLKQENYIRTRVAIFGPNAVIDGKGINGSKGRAGKPGTTPFSPCSDGSLGREGGKGLDGTHGVNLFLYLDEVKFEGNLLINLQGGHGGDGGNGGFGGGGSPGTVHCKGGNGGKGGDAGAGGNGADGGKLVVNCKDHTLKNLIGTSIKANSQGGSPGIGGLWGYQGPAGLGPNKNNGKNGERGQDGNNGRAGVDGVVTFE